MYILAMLLSLVIILVQFLAIMKDKYPELAVIMLSAQSLEENVRKALALGASGFVAKPFAPNSILERM